MNTPNNTIVDQNIMDVEATLALVDTGIVIVQPIRYLDE